MTIYTNTKRTTSALLLAATEILSDNDLTWDSIASSLKCNIASNKQSHLIVLYALLCHAVSENCSQRNTYVERIMKLDKGIQRVLMQIIKESEDMNKNGQGSKSTHPDESYLDELNIDDDNESLLDDDDDYDHNNTNKENIRNINTPLSISTSLSKRTPMSIRSPKYHYRSPMASRNSMNMFSGGSRKSTPLSISPIENYSKGKVLQMQREVVQLKDANEALCKELETSRREECILRTKLEETEAKNRSDQLKIETDNLANTSKMREEYDQRIESLERKLKKAEKSAKESDAMKEEILMLKDEVDVLQSSNTTLKQTEEQLRKMKQKVEQMGDLNKALESEEKAHGEAVAKCIELQNKLAALAPLKRQLEDYKTRATDAEVRLVDCEDELKKLKECTNHMMYQNKELQVNSKRQKAEVEELRQQMTDDQNSTTTDDSQKVGSGMCELNPVLKEELLRLRNENKRLTAFAAKREDDAVQIIEEKLDDAQRLSTKFKDQYLSTKTMLEETKESLEASLVREKGLENDIFDLQDINKQLKQTIDEERKSAKEAEIQALETLALTKQQMEDANEKQIDEINKRWELKLSQIETDHEVKYQNLCAELEAKENHHTKAKSEMLSDHEATIAKLNAEREEEIKSLQEKHIDEVKALEQNCSNARDELITKGKHMIEMLKKEADEKIMSIEAALSAETKEKDNLLEQQKEYEGRVAKKISSYKQKLNVAQAGIQEAISQSDELERNMKKIEKERASLQDENDRYRRQMNGRMGFDQSQYEALKHEYNLLLEENLSLKSSSKPTEYGPESVINGFDVNHARLGSYSMGHNSVSASSISQIREEYEEKVEALCDEKRQLIMKNSALVTEEKRALSQVWDLEVKCKDLQELNTSLQLQVERFERNRSGTTIPMKRLVSNISPRSCNNKPSMKVAKSCSTPLTIQNLKASTSPIISPTDSTMPNIEFRSPEFNNSIKSFRKRMLHKMSTAKKERNNQKNESEPKGKALQLADDEWKIHIS